LATLEEPDQALSIDIVHPPERILARVRPALER
jgi:hypothetical protein